MALEKEEDETEFLRFLVEFGFRSWLEDVFDGKGGEVEEREGEGKKADDRENDNSDDAGVEDSRSTNSTNESR